MKELDGNSEGESVRRKNRGAKSYGQDRVGQGRAGQNRGGKGRAELLPVVFEVCIWINVARNHAGQKDAEMTGLCMAISIHAVLSQGHVYEYISSYSPN